jgi:hypothetical protein
MSISRKLRRRNHRGFIGLSQNLTPDSVSNNLPEQQYSPTLTTLVHAQVGSDKVLDCLKEYQVTIRAKKKLDQHQVSMLIMVLLCEMIQIGVDFSGALTLDFLYLALLGSKETPELIRDQKARQTGMLAKLLISYQRGSWFQFSDRERLPQEVISAIKNTGWLPNRRTLLSWKTWWKPSSFLELRFVRLESLINDHEPNTEPYISYTKGYGNGGTLSRVKKTRFSAELDGETSDRPPVDIDLLEFEKINAIQLAIESAKAARVQK